MEFLEYYLVIKIRIILISFFETKHNLNALQLCDMYNLEYFKASDEMSLQNRIESFYDDSNRPKLLEIFTPSRINDKMLLDYFKFIK